MLRSVQPSLARPVGIGDAFQGAFGYQIFCPTAPAIMPLTRTPLGAHGEGAGFQQGTAHRGRVAVFKRKNQETDKIEDLQRDLCGAGGVTCQTVSRIKQNLEYI